MDSTPETIRKHLREPNYGPSTSNQPRKTPNSNVDGNTSPVLSNSKKSFLRIAKYRSRKKLLGSFSSQDSVASSFTENSELMVSSSPVLLNSQINGNCEIEDNTYDLKTRFKRIKETQSNMSFRYDIAAQTKPLKNTIIPETSVTQICDNSNLNVNRNVPVSTDFNMLSGKKVYISVKHLNGYTKILNDIKVDLNDPIFKDPANTKENISPKNIFVSPQDINVPSINKKKLSQIKNKSETSQITDTQIFLAAENAESMLDLVDNDWNPDKDKTKPKSNEENSQNFNISSINFDSQWGVSPQNKSQKTAEEISDIPLLENVDTQWFFSPNKKIDERSESSCDTKSKTTTISTSTETTTNEMISSQELDDLSLNVTEEENSISSQKKENVEKDIFFGNISFSSDGSTSLRQCSQEESNMQLRADKNSWIFGVSSDDEDTLGFNSKYWKKYSQKINVYVEAFEKAAFPERFLEIDAKLNATRNIKLKRKYLKNKKISYKKQHTTQKTPEHNQILNNLPDVVITPDVSIDEITVTNSVCNQTKKDELDNMVFKIPATVPVKITTKSGNKQNDFIDYCSLEEDLSKICGSPLDDSLYKSASNHGCDSTSEITELLEKESEPNYYIPTQSETIAEDQTPENVPNIFNEAAFDSVPVNYSIYKDILENAKLIDIENIEAQNKTILQKEQDFFEKVAMLEAEIELEKSSNKIEETNNTVASVKVSEIVKNESEISCVPENESIIECDNVNREIVDDLIPPIIEEIQEKQIEIASAAPEMFNKTSGFSFVSGKKSNVKFNNIFQKVLEEIPFETESEIEFLKQVDDKNNTNGFQIASRGFEMASKQFVNASTATTEITSNENTGFSLVSGKKPALKTTNIFNNFIGIGSDHCTSKKEEEFLEKIKNISEHSSDEILPQNADDDETVTSPVLRTKRPLNPPLIPVKKHKSILEENELNEPPKKEEQISNEESESEIILPPNENDNKTCFNNIETDNSPIKNNTSPVLRSEKPFNSPQISGNSSTPILRQNQLGSTNKRRSLGFSGKSCRQLNLSENCAKKAKLIFEKSDEKLKEKVNINNNNILNVSPSVAIVSSTPLIDDSTNTSLLNTSITMKETNQSLLKQNLKIPTRTTHVNNTPLDKHVSSLLVFQDINETNFAKQISSMQKKYELLKLEMKISETRIEMMKKQDEIIKNSETNHRRQRTGCLLCQKSENIDRVSLKQAMKIKPQNMSYEKGLNSGVDKSLLAITPGNALNLSFFVPWWPNDTQTFPSIIHTRDKAILIPNLDNYVGIQEIEQGFLAMPGIDPKLVPENWVRNHYKWIVWKFASYERHFPSQFTGVMSLENVIAQLKYRYDREIDRAQRSAIKKILETDDLPSRRIILCVAAIHKISSNQNELELTDGWYSIKTTIDPLLNNLVLKKKIFIGMKLMIHGAELLNCEGCPPLETPANVRLQIHFNATRRAAWYAKLGYQANPDAFCVPLHSVKYQGGSVGLTTVFVARVYPICFMERADRVIWRDKKAERQRANEWEAMQADIIERLLEDVKKEFETDLRRKKQVKKKRMISLKDVSEIQDPKTIYEVWEESHDPDSLIELLTEEQCKSFQNYQRKKVAEQQTKIGSRLRQKLGEKNVNPRNVSSILKLLIVDVKNLHHYRTLNIWKPLETHIQQLHEGQIVDFYNLSVKDAKHLSTNSRTQFKLNSKLNKTKFETFQRKTTSITSIFENKNKPLFEEFDTVGFVVEVNNEEDNKYLWITNENNQFVLIRIRNTFQESRIFDGLKPGNVIAIQNLLYQKPLQHYATAFATCYTNLYVHPHQSYLQDSMYEFIKNLPENKEIFLDNCEAILDVFKSQNSLKMNQLNKSMMNETNINNTETPAKSTEFKSDVLTASDEEMSLIDTQYFT